MIITKPENTIDNGCLLLTQDPSTDNEGYSCGWRSLLRQEVPGRLYPHLNDKFEYSIMMVVVVMMMLI